MILYSFRAAEFVIWCNWLLSIHTFTMASDHVVRNVKICCLVIILLVWIGNRHAWFMLLNVINFVENWNRVNFRDVKHYCCGAVRSILILFQRVLIFYLQEFEVFLNECFPLTMVRNQNLQKLLRLLIFKFNLRLITNFFFFWTRIRRIFYWIILHYLFVHLCAFLASSYHYLALLSSEHSLVVKLSLYWSNKGVVVVN